MVANEGDVMEQITSKVDQFGFIMQQNVIENEFNRKYGPLVTIQQGMAIEFSVMGANDLYLDLNSSSLHVFAKITKADGTNIDKDTTGPIKLMLHSIFREIGLELNDQNVGDTSQLYQYSSYLETLLNYCQETQETRYLCEGWTKDTTGHLNVTVVGENNAGLNARATTFAKSKVVELVRRPNLNVFYQERLIPPKLDLHMKLIPSPNKILCKSAAPGQVAQLENCKLVI